MWKMFRLLERMSTLVHTAVEYKNWRESYMDCLNLCRVYINVAKNDIHPGTKACLISRMCRMKILNVRLHKHISRIGGNVYNKNQSHVGASSLVWEEMESAFQNRILTGVVINVAHMEPRKFLQDAKRLVTRHISELLNIHSSLKVRVVFEGEFVLRDKVSVKNFGTRNVKLFQTTNLRNWYRNDIMKPILTSLEEFQERDSGWALSKIQNLLVNCNKYEPLQIGCTLSLPAAVQSRKAVINIVSTDNDCFYRAIVACLYPAKLHSTRASSYPHYRDVFHRTARFETPISMKNVCKFEKQNDVSINIFEWKGKRVEPIYITSNKRCKHANLLFIQDRQNPTRNHFAAITSLTRLVTTQLPNKKRRKYICDR